MELQDLDTAKLVAKYNALIGIGNDLPFPYSRVFNTRKEKKELTNIIANCGYEFSSVRAYLDSKQYRNYTNLKADLRKSWTMLSFGAISTYTDNEIRQFILNDKTFVRSVR